MYNVKCRTKKRVAWVIKHNPGAETQDSMWAVMSQNLSTPQFNGVVQRVLQIVRSPHKSGSLAKNSVWALLGKHVDDSAWTTGLDAFLKMQKSAGNGDYFWSRFGSTGWGVALPAMKQLQLAKQATYKYKPHYLGISREVLSKYAKEHPNGIHLTPALPSALDRGLCSICNETPQWPCMCGGPFLVE